MQKRSIGYFFISFIVMIFTCMGIMLYYAFTMKNSSNEAIYELGAIYMEEMNNEITMHFQTTINLRLNQVESMVKRNSADSYRNQEEMLDVMREEGKMHNFNSMALLSQEGDIFMIYGEKIQLVDPQPFIRSLNNNERKVALTESPNGKKNVLMGISASYPMEEGQECTALIASIPIEDVEEILSFDKENALTYSSIVRKNGDFVVNNFQEVRNNFFDRLRDKFADNSKPYLDSYISRMQTAMANNESYSAVLPFQNGRRHMYCSPLANSEWYIITTIPYGELDRIVNGLDEKRFALLVLCICVMLIVYFTMFAFYYTRTNRQIKELEFARKEADRANRAKSEFLSNMSHDIRTPMNAISAMTVLASANIDNRQMLNNYLKKIAVSNNHLLQLINNILDMSKIEGGKMELNIDKVSLRELSEDVITIIQQQVKDRNQKFEVFVYNIETEHIYMDSVRLNQIIMNLLSNAVKFTPEQGTVCFSMYQEKSQLGEEYVQLHIIVKDTGIGMSKEFMAHIFEPFTRQDHKRVQKTEGTGLGMSIVKHIVDALNGTIQVESEPEKGTRFHIMLDVKKEEEEEETKKRKLPKLRVLVADDYEQSCACTVKSLTELGLEAESACNGEAALAKVKECHEQGRDYDLILIDWYLRDMDGIEASAKIHKITGNATTIILVSAYDFSEKIEEAQAAGIRGFFSKPLFKSSLYEGLQKIIGGEEVTPALYEAQKELAGIRLLVAEDNELNWEVAKELLAQAGIETEHAENGKVCVEMFEQSKEGYYAGILMDVRMPVMTGYEATEAIRALERKDSNIVIIAMTADAFAEDIKHCLECGMDAHISKPIELQKVINQLEKFIVK